MQSNEGLKEVKSLTQTWAYVMLKAGSGDLSLLFLVLYINYYLFLVLYINYYIKSIVRFL